MLADVTGFSKGDHAALKEHQTGKSERGLRRRKPGQPPLSLFRAEGRRRRLQRCRRRVPLHREGETGHAHGHLESLEEVGDPATGEPIGATDNNLKASIAGETHEYTDMYPGMAKTARAEGFDEIADWFETLAKAEKTHAGQFQKALDTLGKIILTSHERCSTRGRCESWSRAVLGHRGFYSATMRDIMPSEGSLEAPTRH